MLPEVVALDIGGANLKWAHSWGDAGARPFALWKNPAGLGQVLEDCLRIQPPFAYLAITMTGELCDCFESKRRGVAFILDAVEQAAGCKPVWVWLNDGNLVDLAAARARPQLVAAANWLALAECAGRILPQGAGLLIDIGSTTSDIIPLLHGKPVPLGRTDSSRLQSGELVYMGVHRTPVCAIIGALGAAELFATTRDVYLVLGNCPEDPGDCDTADGRPATRAHAARRLARMLCADREEMDQPEIVRQAQSVKSLQLTALMSACKKVTERLSAPIDGIVLAGSGEFLARELVQSTSQLAGAKVISLAEKFDATTSAAACAYALAVVAAERLEALE